MEVYLLEYTQFIESRNGAVGIVTDVQCYFLFIFISTAYVNKFFIYLCSKCFCLLGLPFASLILMTTLLCRSGFDPHVESAGIRRGTTLSNNARLARVYCANKMTGLRNVAFSYVTF
jgi:hypothetical protein